MNFLIGLGMFINIFTFSASSGDTKTQIAKIVALMKLSTIEFVSKR